MNNMTTNNNNRVPQLRFPGFEGEWEVKKLGKVFTRITRKNTVDNKNVLTISAQYGLVSQTDFFNKSVAAADVTGYYLLEKGDFAYNKSSSSGNPVGVIKPLKRYDKGVVSTLYICFNCKEPKSIPFWEQYFNAGCLDSEIRTIAQEGARNHGLLNVPTSDFFTLKVLVPTLPEQQKIASCLSSLDELIAAEAQKADALKTHKRGLMQQLFPAISNEQLAMSNCVPKLRFPGFTGEWVVKKLGDCFEIGNGRDYKHLSKGNIPVYGSGGYMCSVNDYLFDGDSACIGRKGTINNPTFLQGKFWTVDTLFYTYDFKNTFAYFVYLLFQNIDWMRHNEAGGVPSLSKGIIKNIKVLLPPTLAEQQKIADCLSELDEMISAQQQKVEALKEHKKGLMQKLFPKISN